MAIFKPGHLHIEREALQKGDYSYDLTIDYELHKEIGNPGIDFHMQGSIEGKKVDEKFFLRKEEAYNFASDMTRIGQKYGLPKTASIGSMHKIYDEMFEDIRQKLNAKSGDPVDVEHFE